jgi:hypothetical protein
MIAFGTSVKKHTVRKREPEKRIIEAEDEPAKR